MIMKLTLCSSLASVGAAIVLLSLPVDLFFQQIVHYPSPYVNSNPRSTIPAATIYHPRDSEATQQGRPTYKPPVDMFSFFQSLFLSNSSMPELKYSCPTSNCTWQPFETLGVCSQCQSLNSKLTYGCYDAPFDWDWAATNISAANVTFPMRKQCGYFLNLDGRSPVLMSGFLKGTNGSSDGPALGMRFSPLADPFTRRPIGNGSFFFSDIKNPLHRMVIAATPGGPSGAFANVVPSVQECVFYWCVQSVNTSYYLGQLREKVTNTYTMNTQDVAWGPVVPSTGTPANYFANFTLKRPALSNDSEPEIEFSVSNVTTAQAIQLFDIISPSFVGTNSPGGASMLRWGNAYVRTPPLQQPMPDEENPWLADNAISSHTQQIAKMLTDVVRNAAPKVNNLHTISGDSWTVHTFVEIRWEWIALPITLLVASLIFLVATVVRSSLEEEHVGIWKTSALAILFNGLGEDVQNMVDPNARMGDVRETARGLKVKLAPD